MKGIAQYAPARCRLSVIAMVMCLAAPASGFAQGPTIEEVVEVADISGLSISPDGETLVFRIEKPSIQRNSYLLDWYAADLRRDVVRRIGGGGEPVYGDAGVVEAEPAFWSPDGSFIFHRALVDEAIGIWRVGIDGSRSRAVVVEDADVERVERASGSGAIFYTLGPSRAEIERAERREYDDGILVDESVDLGQSVYRGGSINGRMATQRLIGRWFARAGLLWRLPRMRKRLDLETLASGPAEPVLPPTPTTGPMRPSHSLGASSASGEMALADRGDSGSTLRVMAGAEVRATCRAEPCRSAPIIAVAWRPGHNEVLFTTQDRHTRQSLHIWNVSSGRVRTLVRGEGLVSGARDERAPCVLSSTEAYCVFASAVSPPRIEAIDLQSAHRRYIYDPNAALRGRRMPRVEQLSWELPDGRTATGTILMPAAAHPGRLPLFITYYRCAGYLRGGQGDEWPFAALVDAGFVVACINALPYPGAQDTLAGYRTGQAAIETLASLLESRRVIDSRRIAMGGFSSGAEATMWMATNTRMLAAASIASPQLEPSYYWVNAVRGRDVPGLLRASWGLGRPEETPERWRLMSAAMNVERISAALLMQMPEQEARSAMELYARLSNSTTPAELYVFPDEAHIKIQPRHRRAVYQRNLDWFRFWLQGYVDPDPERTDQYRRWDELARRRAGSAPAP